MGRLADLLPATTSACVGALAPHTDVDWRTVQAGELDWTCWDTAVHLLQNLYHYSVQVVHHHPGPDYLSTELALDEWVSVPRLVDAIAAHGELLRRAVVAADPDDRAFHLFGVSDPEGFAAMGVVECLVHTGDMVRGLDPTSSWRPPAEVAGPVAARLFPEASGLPAADPTDQLLYLCGRAPLGDLPRRTRWRWDGTVRDGGSGV